MEYFNEIINTTISSFDFTYCLIVNILTYIIIKTVDEINGIKEVKTWLKRVILLCCILFTGGVYLATGQEIKLLFNSAILSTVSWDLIFKPICKKFHIDYKKVDNTIKK